MTRPHRSRLTVLNQYYRPGIEATANLLAELCEALAEKYDVTVVTGRPLGSRGLPRDEVVNGVRIIRTFSTAFDRTTFRHRAINYITFVGHGLIRAASLARPDLIICMTDPPMVGAVGAVLARWFRARLLVIVQDVYPEAATAVGRLTTPSLIDAMRRLVAFYLRRADRVVAIGDRMKERLVAKGAPADRVAVIENWVDTRALTPALRENAWARRHRLTGRFVVMHSGNVGQAQNLDALVVASTLLGDLDDLAVPIIGFGTRLAEIRRLTERLGADKVRFMPYQSRDDLSQALATAHLHYIGLGRGLSGLVVPSRIYGILAVARPVIVAAEPDSETARLVEAVGCGVVVPPDRADLLAAAIRDAHDGRFDLDGMGRRGREYVERHGDRSVAIARYEQLIGDLVANDRVMADEGASSEGRTETVSLIGGAPRPGWDAGRARKPSSSKTAGRAGLGRAGG